MNAPPKQSAPRLLAVALSVSFALSGAGAARAEIVDRVVVQVDDGIITQSDVVRFLPIYVQVYGVTPAALSGSSCDGTVREFLTFLVEARLLHATARSRELGVSRQEVDDYVSQQYSRLGMNQEQFVREIEASGIEFEDFREFMELNLNRMRMLQVDVGARISVSDAEIDRAVERLYPDGLEEVFIETHHIFVQVGTDDPATEAAAVEAIRARQARLAAGEPFESVAANNDDGTARTGGRLGRISVLDLDAEYARSALALEVGEVSEPIRSSFGYHLIRLDGVERRPVENAQSIRDRVLFDLHNAEAEQEQDLYLSRVKNEAYVHYVVDDLSFYCAGM